MRELLVRPVLELAELIRTGEVSARELVLTSLEQIEQLEPHINAFTHVAHDAALRSAETIEPIAPAQPESRFNCARP